MFLLFFGGILNKIDKKNKNKNEKKMKKMQPNVWHTGMFTFPRKSSPAVAFVLYVTLVWVVPRGDR